ncbi:MAG: helix-turn-helix domain-containing protein [Ruthenibacterium sp.]
MLLRELRKQRGLTMKELGEKIGVSESTISLYETGRRSPSYEILLKIAEYFGVSVDYLLRGGEEKEKPASQEDDELIKNDPLAGQLFAAYGEVKNEFTQDDIDDIKMFMEMIVARKRKKKENDKK